MKAGNALKTIGRAVADPFETIKDEALNPLWQEAANELGLNLYDKKNRLSSRPQELAKEDLDRARKEKELEEKSQSADADSVKKIEEIKREYQTYQNKVNSQEHELKQEMEELQKEVVELAKAAGVETKAHLQNSNKVSKLDIKLITSIIRSLRFKAEESKSAQELVSQRSNSKRTTGMLAWVSGKQMKIHEQGTLTLQG